MIIKKIFEKNFDEEVHSNFLKFGRGVFKDRFLIEGKRQSSGSWAIKTGPEYVNFLVQKCLEKTNGKVKIKGIIVSTADLREEISFEIKKASNFKGVRKISIDTEIETSEIKELMKKYPRFFYALSFSGENFSIKVKEKAPKSGKPGKESEEGPKADFCTLKTTDRGIINELFFDVGDFEEAKASHEIIVEEIVYPKNYESLKPSEIRELSKRKGKIIRKLLIDGRKKTSEADFIA